MNLIEFKSTSYVPSMSFSTKSSLATMNQKTCFQSHRKTKRFQKRLHH